MISLRIGFPEFEFKFIPIKNSVGKILQPIAQNNQLPAVHIFNASLVIMTRYDVIMPIRCYGFSKDP
jgi:hypothetical protein